MGTPAFGLALFPRKLHMHGSNVFPEGFHADPVLSG